MNLGSVLHQIWKLPVETELGDYDYDDDDDVVIVIVVAKTMTTMISFDQNRTLCMFLQCLRSKPNIGAISNGGSSSAINLPEASVSFERC